MSFKQKKQFTNRSDYWNTPKKLYDFILSNGFVDYNVEGSFIDPFNVDVNLYHCKNVFINPPFSILSKNEFIETIQGLIENGNNVLLLIPARTDTKYFHYLLDLDPFVYFIKGRLKFNDLGSAPFPSLFIGFGDIDIDFYSFFNGVVL